MGAKPIKSNKYVKCDEYEKCYSCKVECSDHMFEKCSALIITPYETFQGGDKADKSVFNLTKERFDRPWDSLNNAIENLRFTVYTPNHHTLEKLNVAFTRKIENPLNSKHFYVCEILRPSHDLDNNPIKPGTNIIISFTSFYKFHAQWLIETSAIN